MIGHPAFNKRRGQPPQGSASYRSRPPSCPCPAAAAKTVHFFLRPVRWLHTVCFFSPRSTIA